MAIGNFGGSERTLPSTRYVILGLIPLLGFAVSVHGEGSSAVPTPSVSVQFLGAFDADDGSRY